MKINLDLAFLLSHLFCLPALSENFTKGDITVESPWVQKSDTGENRAEGFALIHNGGFNEDRLLSISADISDHVVIHETIKQYGKVKMQKVVEPLAIEPNGYLEFKPGDYHFMFFNCRDELREGEMIPAVLHFEKNGDVKVNFTIETSDDVPDNP